MSIAQPRADESRGFWNFAAESFMEGTRDFYEPFYAFAKWWEDRREARRTLVRIEFGLQQIQSAQMESVRSFEVFGEALASLSARVQAATGLDETMISKLELMDARQADARKSYDGLINTLDQMAESLRAVEIRLALMASSMTLQEPMALVKHGLREAAGLADRKHGDSFTPKLEASQIRVVLEKAAERVHESALSRGILEQSGAPGRLVGSRSASVSGK